MQAVKTEWLVAISNLILAIIAILAFIVAIQTKNEWKIEKRYDAFISCYNKLEAKNNAIHQVIVALRAFNLNDAEYKQNPKKN